MSLIVSLVLPGIIFIATIISRFRWRQLDKIPGPWFSKWTGIVLQYHYMRGNKTHYVHSLHETYVDISDINAVAEIHRIGSGYLKSPWYKTVLPKGVQNTFNTTDPVFHGKHRRLLSGPISDSALRTMEPIIDALVQLTVHKMQDEMKSDGVVDIFKWWSFMATDIIGELSFGKSFGLLEHGRETQFSSDLKGINSREWSQSTFSELLHLARSLPPSLLPEGIKAGFRMFLYSDSSIQQYKKQLALNPTKPKPTLFTKLFNSTPDGLTDDGIRDEAMSYIIAGTDTTTVTLTYLIYSVCKNPDVKEKLVKEVQSLPANFTDRDTRNLHYLEQVMNEALRLFAPSPAGLPRTVPAGGATLGGYFVPGGITVLTQAYTLHRHPDVFPEADTFNPSRWANPTKEMKNAFLAFGGGSRVCLGQYLARREIRLAVSYFFRAFPNVQLSSENMKDGDMDQVIYFLMSPKGKRCLVESS